MLNTLLGWIENTRVATAVGQSLLLTGLISAVHLLGLTLLAGGAAVALAAIAGRPDAGTARVGDRRRGGEGDAGGLGVSVASGLLLFVPRATSAAGNSIFQRRMLLVAAAAFHFTLYRGVTHWSGSISWALRPN